MAISGNWSIRAKTAVQGCASAATALLMASAGFALNGINTLWQATFNRLLHRIQASERVVQQSQEELERRVVARAKELSDEIDRLKAVQRDLEAAKDAAEAASKAKSEFLANISHEIRTPLNGILGFADILLRDGDVCSREERSEHLQTIRQNGRHLLELISNVLDLSKIEAGRLDVEHIPCSVHETITDAISALQEKAREKGVSLGYRCSSPLPEVILSDPVRLRQLLLNLAGNAVKFTEAGSVEVIAGLSPGPPALVQIEIVDTGIGIPADKLECIFDPFTQADNSVPRRFGGTGLGLAISRRIARALGGELTVRSEVGKGSHFLATIDPGPLQGARLGNAAREAARQLDWPLRDPPLALPAARILVVDDSDTNRKLIRLILRRSGSETVAAENGQQAVEATLREHFDLILMDMQMPVLDGYAAVRELRSRRVQTPILALTAHAMKGDAEKCFEAGCTGYLTKPIDADRLVAAVASLLATGCGDRSPARPRSADSGSAPTSVPEPGSRIVTSLPADDPEFGEIVVEFIERMRARLAEMENLAAHCRWQELGRQAHWLKGVGGTAGFSVLTEPARELERCAREGRLEDCRRALDQLVALASRIEA